MTELTDMLEIIEPSANERGNEIVAVRFADIVASIMNQEQFEIISGRTPKEAIKKRKGAGGKMYSYVPHGYVNAQLNKAFGFDWDFDTLPLGNGDYHTYFPEEKVTLRGKSYTRPASCVVRVKLTFRIRDPQDIRKVIARIKKTATGEREDAGGMTMGSLIKAAESDGLKKAASKLGVALDLYWADAEADYLSDAPPTPTLTPEQLEEARTRHADGMSPSRAAEWLTGILGKEITRGDVGQILPELYG